MNEHHLPQTQNEEMGQQLRLPSVRAEELLAFRPEDMSKTRPFDALKFLARRSLYSIEMGHRSHEKLPKVLEDLGGEVSDEFICLWLDICEHIVTSIEAGTRSFDDDSAPGALESMPATHPIELFGFNLGIGFYDDRDDIITFYVYSAYEDLLKLKDGSEMKRSHYSPVSGVNDECAVASFHLVKRALEVHERANTYSIKRSRSSTSHWLGISPHFDVVEGNEQSRHELVALISAVSQVNVGDLTDPAYRSLYSYHNDGLK